jgi:hypothetical protein
MEALAIEGQFFAWIRLLLGGVAAAWVVSIYPKKNE